MLIIGPCCVEIFIILLLRKVLVQKPLQQGTVVEKITSAPTPENKHDELVTEHDQLLSALKDNMNQVQDYLIKLYTDIKALDHVSRNSNIASAPSIEYGNQKNHAVGNFIFDNGIEYKIIDVKKTTINNTIMY